MEMDRFEFLIGDWHLEYDISKSRLSEAATGTGHGSMKRALDNQYVIFDYSASICDAAEGGAHAIFGWDAKHKIYRFWWFETSGEFNTATCDFVDDETLFLTWHNNLLVQTFQKIGPDQVLLTMSEPNADGTHTPVLKVVMSRE